MNGKNVVLGIFVLLTVLFASLTYDEFSRANTLSSELTRSKISSQMLSTSVTTVTTTMTITCPLNRFCGSFSYSPSSPLQVDSVIATNGTEGGLPYVGFDVTFENIGTYPVYIPAGSTGISTSVPSDSTVLSEYPAPLCAGVFEIAEVNPGQSYSLLGPPCGGGVSYALAKAGSVSVAFSFDWTTNATASTYPKDFPNSTTISAQFIFP